VVEQPGLGRALRSVSPGVLSQGAGLAIWAACLIGALPRGRSGVETLIQIHSSPAVAGPSGRPKSGRGFVCCSEELSYRVINDHASLGRSRLFRVCPAAIGRRQEGHGSEAEQAREPIANRQEPGTLRKACFKGLNRLAVVATFFLFPFSFCLSVQETEPAGCCCDRQCSVPSPRTRSTQWMPTTSRSGNRLARVSSAMRSAGSLKVGTSTRPLAM
jgi:hypothetical protein